MVFLISFAAFAAILLGGLFAIRFRDRLHLILGFSSGSVIGVAFFDLLPESIELASVRFDVDIVMSVCALGFVLFMVLDRFVILHSHHDDGHDHGHSHGQRGILAAGSISIHSFLDGAAIGLAFQVSAAVGAIVATAVIVHGFSDGINTVNMIMKSGGTRRQALRWAVTNAVAPVLGILSTLFFTVPEHILGIILSAFAGFFLYIGASDLLPESHHAHPAVWTTIATLLGVTVMYVAISIAHI